jgi:hypothetical protein
MKLEEIINSAKRHFSDGTAVAAVYTPAYALMETAIVGMSHELSMNSRLLGLAAIYGGLGNLIGLGRNISKKVFKITEESSEKIKNIHDTLYLAGSALIINPVFYLAAGARDPKEIIMGTVAGAVLGAAVGIPMGYAIDAFRDLLDIKKSERIPKKITMAKPGMKKAVATGLVVLSMGLTSAVYKFVPDKKDINPVENIKVESIQKDYSAQDLNKNLRGEKN